MIETTKTLISVDVESILKTLGRTLLKHLEKRALEKQEMTLVAQALVFFLFCNPLHVEGKRVAKIEKPHNMD